MAVTSVVGALFYLTVGVHDGFDGVCCFVRGPQKNPFAPDDPNRWYNMLIAASIAVVLYLGYREMSYREVTWKEFLHDFLAKGAVERLEVVNKKWVRIRLMADYAQRVGSQSQNLWFNIGSVDSFERNLEAVQREMNWEPPQYVPVVYKTEMDASSLIGKSAAKTLAFS